MLMHLVLDQLVQRCFDTCFQDELYPVGCLLFIFKVGMVLSGEASTLTGSHELISITKSN